MFRPTLPITVEGAKHQTVLPGHLWISEEGREMGSNPKNMIFTLFHVSVPNSTDGFSPACVSTSLLLRTS